MGYCTCIGIHCVERVLLADLPKVVRATMPKEFVWEYIVLNEFFWQSCLSLWGQLCQKNEFNTIYSHTSAITFLFYTMILFYISFPWFKSVFIKFLDLIHLYQNLKSDKNLFHWYTVLSRNFLIIYTRKQQDGDREYVFNTF